MIRAPARGQMRAKRKPVVDAFVNEQFATMRGNFVKAPPP